MINRQKDGNTTYIFSLGDGHDGIVEPTSGKAVTNIDVILKDILPSDVKIYTYRSFQDEVGYPEGTDGYMYGFTHLKVVSTGDTLVLPWIPRDTVLHRHDAWYDSLVDYSQDSIQFKDGTVWNMEQIERYVTYIDIPTPMLSIYDVNPDLVAWITPEVYSYM